MKRINKCLEKLKQKLIKVGDIMDREYVFKIIQMVCATAIIMTDICINKTVDLLTLIIVWLLVY